MILEAIALGFSTGTYCTMYCAPVLVPFLFSSKKDGFSRNAALTGLFLGSRLLTYFVLGIILSCLGLLAGEFFDPSFARKLSYYAYILCGISLLFNSRCSHGCRFEKLSNDYAAAVITGLSVGLHICPPLWTAMFRTMNSGKTGFLYMIFFYVGSLPYFLPYLGIPFAAVKVPALKRIARITKILLAFYYIFFVGLIPLVF
ncbi:MAG: sulfite exporter TauE/SafE family protein [Spirochaetia bacterium]|nr:sulfite exporter TauE/SafE family protein [Spirochaetia bacterium]